MEKFEIVIQALEKSGKEFSAEEKTAIEKAFSSRGAYKGYLKKSKPNGRKEPMASVAWTALQPNAFKISIGSIWFMDETEKALYNKIALDEKGCMIRYPAALDKDMETLTNLGVW